MSVEQTETTLLIAIWTFSILLGLVVYKFRKTKLLRKLAKTPAWKILCVLTMTVGLGAVILGAYSYRRELTTRNYETTLGTVRSIEQLPYIDYQCTRYRCKGNETTEYKMTVQYIVRSKSYSTTENINADPEIFQEGDKVKVAYNPSDPPKTAKIISNDFNRGLGQVLTILGCLFLFSGAGVLFVKKRNK